MKGDARKRPPIEAPIGIARPGRVGRCGGEGILISVGIGKRSWKLVVRQLRHAMQEQRAPPRIDPRRE
jgi:hypothetical protein